MSRRIQQQIRRLQREQGVPFSVARQLVLGAGNNAGGSSGSGGADGPARSGGWDESEYNRPENTAIGEVMSYPGNALPEQAAAKVCKTLGIPGADVPLEVMVTAVRAYPADFPVVDSGVTAEYDYGLVLLEVTVEFDVDVEMVLSASAAQAIVVSGRGTVTLDEGEWATVHCRGLGLRYIAQVRSEFEQAEVCAEAYELRDRDSV